MPACCARSASTAPRPISTPTSPPTITSISSTITSWSTFPTRTWRCPRCPMCPMATRSPASTWSYACARSAELPLSPRRPGEGRDPYRGIICGAWWTTSFARTAPWGYGSRPSPGRPRSSIHLLVGVDAPQPLLLNPAVKPLAVDVAPVLIALLDLGDNANLQAGGHGAVGVGILVHCGEIVLVLHGDYRGAAA